MSDEIIPTSPIPNELFDKYAGTLTGDELKVAMRAFTRFRRHGTVTAVFTREEMEERLPISHSRIDRAVEGLYRKGVLISRQFMETGNWVIDFPLHWCPETWSPELAQEPEGE